MRIDVLTSAVDINGGGIIGLFHTITYFCVNILATCAYDDNSFIDVEYIENIERRQ